MSEKIKNFLDSRNRLKIFPAKRKMKLYALLYLSTKFERDIIYTEKEFNDILNQWHTFGDPATLRRELYNYMFVCRDLSCNLYWMEGIQPTMEDVESKF